MKHMNILLFATIIVGAAVGGDAGPQPCCGDSTYNPATEITLTGTIEEVKTAPSPGRGGGGLHVLLLTEAGVSQVHLGPASFVSAKNVNLEKGDALTVVGSKITMQGEEIVIAREIRKGDQVLTLRDAKGLPLWSRGNRSR
jgi:hypothetical protein